MGGKKYSRLTALVSDFNDLFQMRTSQNVFCFLMSIRTRYNLLTQLLFCVFGWLPACGPKGKYQAEEGWSVQECVHGGDLQNQPSSTISAQQGESRPGSAESRTHTDTQTHTLIHQPELNIQPRLLLSLPGSHAFLHCAAAPDFMATGTEWRGRITSLHIVNQTLCKQQLLHIKLKL